MPILERVITTARPGRINCWVYFAPVSQRKPRTRARRKMTFLLFSKRLME
jgi:hypothetical protein